MQKKVYVIVTSVGEPNKALKELAKGCVDKGYQFVIIGDEASPADFHIEGCEFYGLDRQRQLDFKFAELCPTKHYARKNIGYLLAVADSASIIIETDDDNIPCSEFWKERQKNQDVAVIENAGWINVYRYFSDNNIWPRGFPLEKIQTQIPPYESLQHASVDCPIQQNLADDNPDVDAVYRLVMPLPQRFKKNRSVAVAKDTYCPFNSQNTTWWPQAYKLLYLPAYCSFRMTDIWRSFVAQRIAALNGWAILFGEPTMRQERNVHNLLNDFQDEVPGYLHNSKICEALEALPLESGVEKISSNLRFCYEKLVEMNLVGREELKLLDVWLKDIENFS